MATHGVRFGVPLLISAVLYVGTIAVNCVFMTMVTLNGEMKEWFLPYIGILLLPSVILQLVSAVLLLLEKGDKLSVTSSAIVAIIHIFQLGFLWRHVTLFREIEPISRARGHTDLKYLQLLFAFTTSVPLLFIHSFIVLHYQSTDIIMLMALVITFLSSSWFIASFRKSSKEEEIESVTRVLPGKLCRLLWRGGELTSRMISLTVFASVYYYWIFLIFGLHCVTMLVCLCTPVLGMFERPDTSKSYKVLIGLILAYIYSFCFVNLSSENTLFRYSIYYVIMFFENAVLILVWYIHAEHPTIFIPKVILVAISAGTFAFGIICLILYNKCFHTIPLFDPEKEHIYESDICINCKLSVCSKHCIKLQRPFSAGWISQYQKAISNGHYYRNILHDTLLDSDGDATIDLLNSSGEHWQIRDTDLESIKTVEKKQYTSVQASGTYTHKRFFDSNSSITKMSDTDSIASGSGVYDEDWRQKSDTILSQLSAMDALSLVSSNTRLLTDSWDTLIQESKENLSENQKQPKRIDILNSLIKKDLDTSFFSDGYLTDHTLDSYQLPVTVLAKKRLNDVRRKVEPAYSTASDSTDCTICAFMRQHQSSPELSRRSVEIYDQIPEQSHLRMIKKKKRDCVTTKKTNRHRKSSKKTQQISAHSLNSHLYEKSSSCQRRRDLIRVSDSTTKPKPRICPVPYTKPLTSHTRSDNNTFQMDTSLEELKCVKRNMKISTVVPRSVFMETNLAESVSDSGDSAFPRHTPISDVTNSSNTNNTLDSLYSKVVRKRNKPNEENLFVKARDVPDTSGINGATVKTSLADYLAVADAENDGTSESSCEMII
ncbi:XK-related protein 6 [Mactra antiquata]